MRRDEGEEQERGAKSPGKGERGIPGAGEAAAFASSNHVAAGQGLGHPADHQLPEDEAGFPRR